MVAFHHLPPFHGLPLADLSTSSLMSSIASSGMLEICLDLKSTENDGLGWRPGETFLRCFSSLNSSRACARALETMAKQTACSAGREDIFCSAGMLDGGTLRGKE